MAGRLALESLLFISGRFFFFRIEKSMQRNREQRDSAMSFFFLRSWSPISPCEEVLGLWDVGRRGHTTRNHQPHIRAGMNHRHLLRFCLVVFLRTWRLGMGWYWDRGMDCS